MTASEPGKRPDGDPEQPLKARSEGGASARVEELSTLSTHLLRMMESERSQLAKELHDELGGLITAAKMDMQWLSARIGGSLDAASDEKFKSVMQMLNQAMTMKRRVVENLRPSLLDHFGLAVALRSHFEENCRSSGIDCVASLPEETIELPQPTQLALFRVAQQVLVSVLARGNAKHVELVMEAEEGGYALLIGDDGSALDENFDRALVGLRHRIQGMGGTLVDRYEPGQGNRVRTFVPRSPAKSE
jgi:signal transduction histidine kinase